MNKAILIGRLGNDPETKTFESGNSIVNFSLATSDGKDKNGDGITNWHRVTVMGKAQEVAQKYLKKGSQCLVEGMISYREYDGKYYTDIKCFKIELLDSKNSSESNSSAQAPKSNQKGDDGLPF